MPVGEVTAAVRALEAVGAGAQVRCWGLARAAGARGMADLGMDAPPSRSRREHLLVLHGGATG